MDKSVMDNKNSHKPLFLQVLESPSQTSPEKIMKTDMSTEKILAMDS